MDYNSRITVGYYWRENWYPKKNILEETVEEYSPSLIREK
jgi:hypothetical protein